MSGDVIVFAGLMPHAPILVPSVGGECAAEVSDTVRAMTRVAHAAIAAQPDALIIISPHSPRRPGAFGLWTTPRLRGSFESFGSSADHVDVPLDAALTEQLREEAAARGLRTWRIGHGLLDHGAMVPLAFLQRAGWRGPTVILSLSETGAEGLDQLGQAIAAAAAAQHRRVALIASGDMSHRLTPDAPCGYHPDGARFDRAFVEALGDCTTDAIRRIDATWQDNAAEDVVDSTRVALAATGFSTVGRDVLSYEGPFGVGYGVAILSAAAGTGSIAGATTIDSTGGTLSTYAVLPRLARRSVEAKFADQAERCPYTGSGELNTPRGVFVTIRADDGELRGCRGSPFPSDVVRETWEQAQAAAFRDSRFAQLRVDDLPHVRFTVNVLGELEAVDSTADLDPARFGVLVTAIDGRGALLLPGIDGIDTVADQMRCVKRKAGIPPDEWVKIERFTAQAFHEE